MKLERREQLRYSDLLGENGKHALDRLAKVVALFRVCFVPSECKGLFLNCTENDTRQRAANDC